mgnify:FL=1
MKIILISAILLLVLNGCSDKEQLSKEQLSKIERMVDKRNPKTIAGSVWTAKYDCTYKNPPTEWILYNGISCETLKHNVKVIKRGDIYFIPRSTVENTPPYCIMKKPTKERVGSVKYMEKFYCDN